MKTAETRDEKRVEKGEKEKAEAEAPVNIKFIIHPVYK